jgi:hypothetical protein
MVAASIRLVASAVLNHSTLAPTAVTTIEASTRPEIASRTPIRIVSNLSAAIDIAANGRSIVYFA